LGVFLKYFNKIILLERRIFKMDLVLITKFKAATTYMTSDSKAGDTLSSRHVSSCDVTRAVGK
jgi:hypothetical protein